MFSSSGSLLLGPQITLLSLGSAWVWLVLANELLGGRDVHHFLAEEQKGGCEISADALPC